MSDEIIAKPDLDQVLADEKNRELIEEFESEAKTRTFRGGLGTLVTALSIATSLFALYYAAAGAEIPGTRIVLIPNFRILGQTITTPQVYVMIFLSAILVLTFLLYPPAPRWLRSVTPIDLLLCVGAVAITAYVFVDFDNVIYRVNTPTPADFVMGVVAIVLVIEASRRTIGWHLPALGLLAIAYAYFADFMPGAFRGPPKNLDDIVGAQYLGLDGMLGTPLQVAATYIILFTIYGAILDFTGAGKFYVDLAFAMTGRRPTGAARSVTVASFLLGTVSGSGVATTVTLGSITYPMLKRAGHDRETSGAILSAGGIGAVLSPPVLGPAAFLMAEILKISYLDVVVMAMMPTILYYLGILLMIEVDARRVGARQIQLDAPGFWELTKRYWYQYTSLFAIIVFLVIGFSTITAIFWSILLGVAVSYLRKETALTLPKMRDALSSGTRQVLSIGATTAVAGIAVGILLQTGLGLKISSLILDIAQHQLFPTLILSGIVLWVLGLSLPITATYLVAVPTIIPALAGVGVPLPAAHMFVFYYAILSEVSPPVALSPFAAAAITGGNPYKTMMLTWKYSLPCFLVPLMFTQPGGLAILWHDVPLWDAAVASVSAIAGIAAITTGVGGYLLRRTTILERALLIASGLLLLLPTTFGDVTGLALFLVALALQVMTGRPAPKPAPA
ncbi:MAG: TRAP transporter fused permease subunit [Chloroflexota bacterium]|nr:TRAP transporter fused permease subunit [Chloroflexota bacterium]MDE3194117.1 TRAP transporter fused permease subunit [Chloroflexota bacterium]